MSWMVSSQCLKPDLKVCLVEFGFKPYTQTDVHDVYLRDIAMLIEIAPNRVSVRLTIMVLWIS